MKRKLLALITAIILLLTLMQPVKAQSIIIKRSPTYYFPLVLTAP